MTAINNRAREEMNSPARHYFAITPHDSTNFATETRFIYVGVIGDIALVGPEGSTAVLFKAVPAGTILPVRASRVDSTNTTATLLVGMY